MSDTNEKGGAYSNLCYNLFTLYLILSFSVLHAKKRNTKKKFKKIQKVHYKWNFSDPFFHLYCPAYNKKDNIQIFFEKNLHCSVLLNLIFVIWKKYFMICLEKQSTMTYFNSRLHHKVHSFFGDIAGNCLCVHFIPAKHEVLNFAEE